MIRIQMYDKSSDINKALNSFRVVEYTKSRIKFFLKNQEKEKKKGIRGHYSFHTGIEWLDNCFFDNCSQLNC